MDQFDDVNSMMLNWLAVALIELKWCKLLQYSKKFQIVAKVLDSLPKLEDWSCCIWMDRYRKL